MPISQRELEANRRNAQKSCGPKSAAGKAKVSQNAIKHGLSGGEFQVLARESQEGYDALLERFMQAEKPVDDVERELVGKMARHTWMSHRAVRMQTACFILPERTPEDKANETCGMAVRVDLDCYLRYQAHHDPPTPRRRRAH